MKKTKMKKIITLIVVAVLIVLGAVGYNIASKFIPKKSNKDVSEIVSSNTESDIYIHTDTDGTDDGVAELIVLMNDNGQPFYSTNDIGLIGVNDLIILKINSQWDQRGGTNVDLVESVIDAILDHPDGFTGEIVIADNGQSQFGSSNNGGSMDWDNTNSADRTKSLQDVANSYTDAKVSTYLWDTITTNRVEEFELGDMDAGFVLYDRPDKETKITVSYPKFTTKFDTDVSFKMGIWDNNTQSYDTNRLKVINMPVLKTHMIYGVTGATKGYMGVPSDKLSKNSHSTIGIGSMGTLMVESRMPSLNIMDAIYINAHTAKGNSGPGTSYENATFTKTVLISTDPIALDYYATINILYPTTEQTGEILESKHLIDSNKPGTFGYWLRLSMEQIQDGGFNSVMDDSKIKTFVVK